MKKKENEMKIGIKFTPLSGNQCVFQFIRIGVEAIGDPVIISKEMLEKLTDRDEVFYNLYIKREPFVLFLENETKGIK